MTNSVKPLIGAIQHYAWGGKRFIPELIQMPNPSKQSFAELWMGTHYKGPAIIINGENQQQELKEYISNQPEILGDKIIQNFGVQLPFLFKILDVNAMLSIQSHPTKKQAEIGFKRENEAGIPADASYRNYKDNNHKPELMVALSDFWLLHGFQEEDQIDQILKEVPEFHSLLPFFVDRSIPQLYRVIMEMPQTKVNALLEPLKKRLESSNLSKNQAEFWALKAFKEHTTADGNYDRGIFSIFLFNLVFLQKGEGIFQDAGIPHAYLEGVNVELMANSDNVFRGGLTVKHVDVPELMANLVFDPIHPKVIRGQPLSTTETYYPTPAPDFALSQIKLTANQKHLETPSSAQIVIVIEGEVKIGQQLFEKGKIFFAAAGSTYEISTPSHATLFKAFVS